jgi:hypothetical protein
MSYLLPAGEDTLDGACASEGALCAWNDRSAYRWTPNADWSALSIAPTPIDSGFELQSGVLAGADTSVGFLPSDGTDWAWWSDLSSFSDAHPMYGDLLLCTDRSSETYTLCSISLVGLDPLSQFGADELAEPVAGWSPPTNPDRILLLGEGGLWALDPPYTDTSLQHLVSFDAVDLPLLEDIPGPFQPGFATVVIPRRSRTALRLDLSDGTGTATGLKHLPGGAALWTAYLRDDRATANRLLTHLTSLPSPVSGTGLRLHDALADETSVQALATSAGLQVPSTGNTADRVSSGRTASSLAESPLDSSALVTWALWLDWDDALETGCRVLCNSSEPDPALAESLRHFAGAEACRSLFDLVRSSPPSGPTGEYDYPAAALRALAAPYGTELAPLVRSALSAPSVPVRVAASAVAGTTRDDLKAGASDESLSSPSVLWNEDHPCPEDVLRENATHDHPAVRSAARETCARLSIEPGSGGTSDYRRSSQSSQPERPK